MCLQIPAPTDRHFDVDLTMKNLLNLSTTWLDDGIFKMSPEIFYQIYTIHVELNGFAPPCVYVLLPNKTEKNL